MHSRGMSLLHTLNNSAYEAARTLARYGAVTHKRLDQRHGPSWHALLDQDYVRTRRTVMGRVVTLTPTLLPAIKDVGWKPTRIPQSPSTIVNRAYLTEAILLLENLRYKIDFDDARWSQAGSVLATKQERKLEPAHVVYMGVRIPQEMGERRGINIGKVVKSSVVREGMPRLYATISGGGVTPAKVKRLVTENSGYCAYWRHPVIVAVPELTPALVRLARRVNAAKEWEPGLPERLWLLHVPLPVLTQRHNSGRDVYVSGD